MKEKLLVSKCLLGQNVRYDGKNCLISGDLLEQLRSKFDLIEICPEFEAGLGVPREPIERLGPKIIDKQGNDYTTQLLSFAKQLSSIVQEQRITKAFLKEKSPSCGSELIYDGHFKNKLIEGEGLITQTLRSIGVKVYSEENVNDLLNC